MKARTLKRIFSIWPPYRGAGIRVRHIADDYSEVIVTMSLHWYNRNYVSTHFGGSLYSMIDPFYMLMIMHLLGNDYIVWDKSAAIKFIAPGTGTVTAHFRMTGAQVAEIREKTAGGEPFLPEYGVDIVDEQGAVVAKAVKRLYIRRKNRAGETGGNA